MSTQDIDRVCRRLYDINEVQASEFSGNSQRWVLTRTMLDEVNFALAPLDCQDRPDASHARLGCNRRSHFILTTANEIQGSRPTKHADSVAISRFDIEPYREADHRSNP